MSESTYNKERYEYYKSHKICVDCGANEAAKGRTRCLECLSKNVERTLEWQKKNTGKNREYQREYQKILERTERKMGYVSNVVSLHIMVIHSVQNILQLDVLKQRTDVENRAYFLGGCLAMENYVRSAETLLRIKVINVVRFVLNVNANGQQNNERKLTIKITYGEKRNDALFFKAESQKGV